MILTVTLNPAIDRTLDAPGFQVGGHVRARLKALLPAGKGNNVARGIARLGGEATACGFIGRGERQMFASSLEADGVQTAFCSVDGVTRTNTTVLDPQRRTTTHLRERGFGVTAADRRALRSTLLGLLAVRSGATVVFAGSLPPGFEPERLAELITSCSEAGAHIVVDSSGAALRAAAETGLVEALKPNLLELGQLLDEDIPAGRAVEAAGRLLEHAKAILLTLGAHGAYLVTEQFTIGRRCPLADEELRNNVGCGDAFLAGWLRGEQFSAGDLAAGEQQATRALNWAVAAGAATAQFS
ncbi:MAG: hypothetical protein J7M08_07050, partial [Planctomycetes bacterium]|nr:hypothetical protein [Planctomycetota bacterium]